MRVTTNSKSPFRQGILAGVSIALGYMPVALTFGLLAKSTGLTVYETVAMSLFVFAGAAQYISLNLLSVGTGVFEIILTTFIVNIRHFLMGASLSEKMEEDHAVKKAVYAFGITDETFSVSSVKEGMVSTSYMFGVILISYSSWVINSGIGHIIGSRLPSILQESMAIALYAMFVGLLMPSMKKEKRVVLLASFAAAIHLLIYMFAGAVISTGWAIVISTICSSILIEWLRKPRKSPGVDVSG